MDKKNKQGGKRKNAGRKSAFNEPTKTISFRIPISKIDELKLYVNAYVQNQKLQPTKS